MADKNTAQDLQAAIEKIYAAQDQKTDKLAALTAERDRLQAQVDADEAALAGSDYDFSQDTQDLVAQVDREQAVRQRIAGNQEKVRILQGQIDYVNDTQDFLDYDTYTALINALQSGYDALLQDELTQAQELADAMTSCGERIHGNRKELQAAATAAFSLYHGFTRFRKKTEHRCVGDETVIDPATKKRRTRNIFRDVVVDDNDRRRPTIGTDGDLGTIPRISRDFNTRGGFCWWNV